MHYRNGIYAKFNIENVMSVADRAWFYNKSYELYTCFNARALPASIFFYIMNKVTAR